VCRLDRNSIILFAAEVGLNQEIDAGDPETLGRTAICRGHFLDLARQLTPQALGRAIPP
jgi:hypothetical protein